MPWAVAQRIKRFGGQSLAVKPRIDDFQVLVDESMAAGCTGGRVVGADSFGHQRGVRSKLARVKGHGDFRGIGDLHDGAAAKLLHLLFDRPVGVLGHVAGGSHQRSNQQKGRRQFQANPHNQMPSSTHCMGRDTAIRIPGSPQEANLAPGHANCIPQSDH